MDGPGENAMWNKPVRERQIPYDSTYMWNLNSNINEQMKQKHAHKYRRQIDRCQWGEGLAGWVKKMKGLSKQTNKKTKNLIDRQQYGDYQRQRGPIRRR